MKLRVKALRLPETILLYWQTMVFLEMFFHQHLPKHGNKYVSFVVGIFILRHGFENI
jgi:hypothetical protein